MNLRGRFEKLVDRSGVCHMWLGSVGSKGYGRITHKGKNIRAHRLAWELHHNKPAPKDMFICHDCDVPLCVNPEHLFAGTHQDNMDDMVGKGRADGNKGEKNGFAKLNKADVIEMRRLYATKEWSMPKLATKYNMSVGQTYNVIRGTRWAHIPGAIPHTIKSKRPKHYQKHKPIV